MEFVFDKDREEKQPGQHPKKAKVCRDEAMLRLAEAGVMPEKGRKKGKHSRYDPRDNW